MEVAGNPHYENVSSNILAFYFDPAAEHGLKNLLVAAFLKMAGFTEDITQAGKVTVHREMGTEQGKRIDLLIESDIYTIGIENKIYHWLANDLEQYSQAIDRFKGSKSILVKAVLGLKPIAVGSLRGGFASYTYARLWQQVRALLGHYLADAHPKWVAYLIDFMETTTNLAGQNMELQATDQFFVDNNKLIEELIAKRNLFLGRLAQKLPLLCDMMTEDSLLGYFIRQPYVWKNSRLALDFMLGGTHAITLDLILYPTNWKLQLFGRNHHSSGHLHKLLHQPALLTRAVNAPFIENRHDLQRWSLQTGLDEIKRDICSWMSDLLEAEKSLSTSLSPL